MPSRCEVANAHSADVADTEARIPSFSEMAGYGIVVDRKAESQGLSSRFN